MGKLDVKNCDNIKCLKSKNKYRNKNSLVPQNIFRFLISGSSSSGKTNLLTYSICHLLAFDKLFIFTRTPHQPKFQMLKEMFEKIRTCNT